MTPHRRIDTEGGLTVVPVLAYGVAEVCAALSCNAHEAEAIIAKHGDIELPGKIARISPARLDQLLLPVRLQPQMRGL